MQTNELVGTLLWRHVILGMDSQIVLRFNSIFRLSVFLDLYMISQTIHYKSIVVWSY